MALDTVANAAATVCSAVIAGVALRFSFLQSVGWAPIAFIGSSSLHGVAGSKKFYIRLHIECWNRRRHPVLLKRITLRASGLLPISGLTPAERSEHEINWVGDYGWCSFDQSIDPASRWLRIIDIHFECDSLDKLKAAFVCDARYFDPVQNNERRLKFGHKFMYPGLGWAKGVGNAARRSFDNSVIKGALSDQKENY